MIFILNSRILYDIFKHVYNIFLCVLVFVFMCVCISVCVCMCAHARVYVYMYVRQRSVCMSCPPTVFFETGSLAGLECAHFIKLVRQQAEFYKSAGVSTSVGILIFFNQDSAD